jgi:hypothetical protein
MKLINEAKRFQQLAGLLNESQLNEFGGYNFKEGDDEDIEYVIQNKNTPAFNQAFSPLERLDMRGLNDDELRSYIKANVDRDDLQDARAYMEKLAGSITESYTNEVRSGDTVTFKKGRTHHLGKIDGKDYQIIPVNHIVEDRIKVINWEDSNDFLIGIIKDINGTDYEVEITNDKDLEEGVDGDEQSSVEEQVFDILASNMNPKLNTFIQPVEFMLDQAFAEDVNISTILEEVKPEMEFQLERANNNKDLRLIFAKIEAILINNEEDLEEGIKSFFKALPVAATLAFGSPEKAAAQSPQGMEQTAFDSTFSISSMDDDKAGEALLISYQKNPFTADMWSKLSNDNKRLFNTLKGMINSFQAKPEDVQPEDIAALGRKYKNTPAAAEFLDREKAIKAAKTKTLEETINEALRKFRKSK